MLQFESDTKEIKDKFAQSDLRTKIEGMKELQEIFGKCYDLADQLQVFATKCTPLLKTLLSGMNLKEITKDEDFPNFVSTLKTFANQLIFDTQLFV